jgi:hypothetical protein
VSCGSGTDSANADEHDTVDLDCENVSRADPPPPPVAAAPAQDAPPGVAFSLPAEGALLAPVRTAAVAVEASDDNGVARVDLVDDGRVVESDTSAPYRFSYTPQVNDVGRKSLSAVAVDSASQTAGAVRQVRVARFRPRIRARAALRPNARVRVAGRLRLPAPLTRAQGCSRGRVILSLRWGGSTLARNSVRLRQSCRFSGRMAIGPRELSESRRLRARARFRGNRLVRPRSSAPVRPSR